MAIVLKIEMTTTKNEVPSYWPVTEYMDGSLTSSALENFKIKYETAGNTIHSWTVTEVLPYDEGYAAAAKGKDVDQNPYSDVNWNNDEWWQGFNAHGEANGS